MKDIGLIDGYLLLNQLGDIGLGNWISNQVGDIGPSERYWILDQVGDIGLSGGYWI